MTLEDKIKNLIKPLIEKAGYELVNVQLRFQRRNLILTITIKKEGGLSVEDCAKVSRMLDPILDKADFIKQKYYLTVSSPGI